ncbi:MAG TPA: YdeI/OmpD-associated family protein [Gammaproteobacteria bacterium]|nr:YdeI/OmpD-associated family protein [Gammaproteobacteria bacterium]
MAKKDPRLDTYIAKAAPFARPVLKHLRKRVHAACPQVEETLKWGAPSFLYRSRILCGMAAFKAHCAFFFWHKELRKKSRPGMGQLGRITALTDLPSDTAVTELIKRAMRLNEQPKAVAGKLKVEKELTVPACFMSALRKNRKALATFRNFSYSRRKEYVEWIAGAKTDATRDKRLATAVEWLAQGRVRNWKYIEK